MKSANDKVVLALIGAGGRGTFIILGIQKSAPGVEVKYVCDVDRERGGRAISELEKQQKVKPVWIEEMRQAMDDKDVDGIVIATPEHWHALATIWACQAGKDVYVEKNISLNITEGRKMAEAARKYNRIVQCGWQNRSAEYNMFVRDYLKAGKLGKISLLKINYILPGAGNKPLLVKEDADVPAGLNWDMWLGPAPERPYNLSRHKSYNEFWDYSCGILMADCSHAIDLSRMVLGDPGYPKSVFCTGGRELFDDKREVPDSQIITFDMGEFPITIEAISSGEYMSKTSTEIRYGDKFPNWPFNGDRIEIYGTEGMMYLGRTGAGFQVIGEGGKILAEDYGTAPDEAHWKNFIDCIRSRKLPYADIEQGHRSATHIHLANLSYRVGEKQLYFDGEKERVENSEEANNISKGIYRKGYEIPEII